MADRETNINPAPAADAELLVDFVMETREHLDTVESQVLILERDPANAEAIHAIFRGFHSIKGLAGFFDFAAVQQVAHEVETLLDLARNGQLAVTARVVDAILESNDYIGAWLNNLETVLRQGGEIQAADYSGLVVGIRALLSSSPAASPLHSPEDTLAQLARAAADRDPVGRTTAAACAPSASPGGGAPEAAFVKVNTSKLDALVDMVGQLLVAQSVLRHDPDVSADLHPRMARNLAELDRITSEVQKTAMSMRMLPVGQLFARMRRLVRDLAGRAGKRVDLELCGEDTELDRNIVEELAGPLMHMVRNAVDHGIEPPPERVRVGKPETARLRLRAGHQSGCVLIEVSDDGRGIDRDRLFSKALESGLLLPGAMLSDAELYNLIFHPGLSTADKVTDVSGRGVGMDVVRKQIQKLRGRIEIQTSAGRGTSFFLRLPLTLAIINGLVARAGAERYIVPLHAVRSIVKPSPDMLFTVQGAAEMALIRGQLLPVVHLRECFAVAGISADAGEGVMVVLEAADRRFCLMVDEVLGKQEVVLKSLGEHLRNVDGLSGGAILGDGRVGLILDPERIFSVYGHV